MNTDWKNLDDAWPSWGDINKRVQFEDNTGTIHSGFCRLQDVHFDGEDEYGVYEFEDETGTIFDLGKITKWRDA